MAKESSGVWGRAGPRIPSIGPGSPPDCVSVDGNPRGQGDRRRDSPNSPRDSSGDPRGSGARVRVGIPRGMTSHPTGSADVHPAIPKKMTLFARRGFCSKCLRFRTVTSASGCSWSCRYLGRDLGRSHALVDPGSPAGGVGHACHVIPQSKCSRPLDLNLKVSSNTTSQISYAESDTRNLRI